MHFFFLLELHVTFRSLISKRWKSCNTQDYSQGGSKYSMRSPSSLLSPVFHLQATLLYQPLSTKHVCWYKREKITDRFRDKIGTGQKGEKSCFCVHLEPWGNRTCPSTLPGLCCAWEQAWLHSTTWQAQVSSVHSGQGVIRLIHLID